MSIFRVKLNNLTQGSLDLDPNVPGSAINPSLQRTVTVSGPKGVRRQLKDGDEFTDCNYWKQFSYPQVSKEDAFIEVVFDDGSFYSPMPGENNFPRVYTINVDDGSSYNENIVDVLGDNGGFAKFVQIHNFSTGGAIKIKVNGSVNAVFDLDQGAIQQFNSGDMNISKLQFHNDSGTDSTVQIILSVISEPKS